jgi:hypothetical protein
MQTHREDAAMVREDAAMGFLWLLLLLEVILTIVLLYPLGRRMFRSIPAGLTPGSAVLRRAGVIALLLVLAPVAFLIVFLSVCAVCAAVGGGI